MSEHKTIAIWRGRIGQTQEDNEVWEFDLIDKDRKYSLCWCVFLDPTNDKEQALQLREKPEIATEMLLSASDLCERKHNKKLVDMLMDFFEEPEA